MDMKLAQMDLRLEYAYEVFHYSDSCSHYLSCLYRDVHKKIRIESCDAIKI